MGCCGMFSKSKKSGAASGGGAGFAPRPVQQGGYAPTAAALKNQQQYAQQHGGAGNIQDPAYLRSLAANQAVAGSAADFAVRTMGAKGQKLAPIADKGAGMAAEKFTKQQYNRQQQQQQAGY
ncbi:hypothetical protein B0I37DRAFT_378361 [Chaetomium sp. MPI-CAGE-AT-0009]|nr:hypothetical protein B0I37DRAFT_378361 [Chaetomium sp. MPI-CAGE-AT-0009]